MNVTRIRSWAAVVAALLSLLAACGTDTTAPPPVPVALTDHGAMPVALDIPALGLHVVDLQMFGTGMGGGGYPCPPTPDVVSWDSSRSRPGQPGLAQLVASGHGAFSRLVELGDDDPAVLMLSDGRRLTFTRNASILTGTGPRAAALQLSACGTSVAATVYLGLVS